MTSTGCPSTVFKSSKERFHPCERYIYGWLVFVTKINVSLLHQRSLPLGNFGAYGDLKYFLFHYLFHFLCSCDNNLY